MVLANSVKQYIIYLTDNRKNGVEMTDSKKYEKCAELYYDDGTPSCIASSIADENGNICAVRFEYPDGSVEITEINDGDLLKL